jgi:hypothetical protein
MTNPFVPKDFIVLPRAVWLPRFGKEIYRGSPSQIVIAIASSGGKPVKTIKAAIQHLVEDLTRSHKAKVQVPWELPEGELTRAFLRALLKSGIAKTVPDA